VPQDTPLVLIAHVPLPSQTCPITFPVAGSQLLAPHEAPLGYTTLQAPRPSHCPSLPQLDAGEVAQVSWCGLVWALALSQVPSPVPDCLSAAAHAWQKPHAAEAQQTPSTQCPVVHSRHPATWQSPAAPPSTDAAAGLQAAPCAFWGWHMPFKEQ
jgi:hypothetical protein